MRPSASRFTNPSGLIDKRVGEKYAEITEVNDNLAKISHLSYYLESLFNLDRNLTLLSDENVDHHILKDITIFQGPSAYEIAVKLGYEGTEQEWIDSLAGLPGIQGTPGVVDDALLLELQTAIGANLSSVGNLSNLIAANSANFANFATLSDLDDLEQDTQDELTNLTGSILSTVAGMIPAVPSTAEISAIAVAAVDASLVAVSDSVVAANDRIDAANLLLDGLRDDLDDNTTAFSSFLLQNNGTILQITALEAKAGDNESSIISLQNVTSTLSSSQTILQSESATHFASISALDQTTAAMATQINVLQVANNTNNSSITNLNTVTANTATALSALVTTTDNDRAYSIVTRTTADANASSITALGVRTDTVETDIININSVAAGQASALAALTVRTATAEASIVTLNTVKADLSALQFEATRIDALEVRTTNTEANVSSLTLTKADQTSLDAEALRIDNVTSRISGTIPVGIETGVNGTVTFVKNQDANGPNDGEILINAGYLEHSAYPGQISIPQTELLTELEGVFSLGIDVPFYVMWSRTDLSSRFNGAKGPDAFFIVFWSDTEGWKYLQPNGQAQLTFVPNEIDRIIAIGYKDASETDIRYLNSLINFTEISATVDTLSATKADKTELYDVASAIQIDRVAAETAASAAEGYRDQAAISVTDAQSSASLASASELLAAASATTAALNGSKVGLTLNSHFNEGLAAWNDVTNIETATDVDGEPYVLKAPNSQGFLLTDFNNLMEVDVARAYKIHFRIKAGVDDQRFNIGIREYDQLKNVLAGNKYTGGYNYLDVSDGWVTFESGYLEGIGADANSFDASTRFLALRAYLGSTTNPQGNSWISELWLEDVTESRNATVSAGAALVSQQSAATSETNAAGSASSANTSEINAATSETNAGNSANAASTSESNAATHASNSETYALASQSSSVSASTSETNAATSENNSSTSAGNAATSAANALTSEGNASTHETNAAGSAGTAQTHANASANSASLALASENASGQSAIAASAAETNAATSASNAATSESNAALSETNADGSASAAAASNTTVQAALEDIVGTSGNGYVPEPSRPNPDRSAFTSVISGLSSSNADLSSAWVDVTDPDMGLSVQSNGKDILASKRNYDIVAGEEWRFTTTVKAIIDSTGAQNRNNAYIRWLSASGGSLGALYLGRLNDLLVANGVRTHILTLDIDTATIPTDATMFKFYQYNNVSNGDGVANFSEVLIDKIKPIATGSTGYLQDIAGYAANALVSETNSATSASNAATSENNASVSATAASSSQTAASTSEANASVSASNSATAVTTALGHADDANDSANDASSSASEASDEREDAETANVNAGLASAAASISAASAQTSLEIVAAVTAPSIINNSMFLDWNGTYPAGYNNLGSGGAITKSSAVKKFGNDSLKIVTGGNSSLALKGSMTSLLGGAYAVDPAGDITTNMLFEAWVYIEAGPRTGAGFVVRLLNGATAIDAEYIGYGSYSVPTGRWVYISRKLTYSSSDVSNVTNVEIEIAGDNASFGAASAKTIYVGYVGLRPVNGYEASVSENTVAIADIDGTLASAYGLRVKAGTAGAEFELIALDNINGSSSAARLAADNIILDGTIQALHLADGSIYNVAEDSSTSSVNLGSNNTGWQGPYLSEPVATKGRKVRIDVDMSYSLGIDTSAGSIGVAGVGYTTDHRKSIEIRLKRNGTVISTRKMGSLFVPQPELQNIQDPPTIPPALDAEFSNSCVFTDQPSNATHTYTVEVKAIAKSGGSDNRKTLTLLQDRSMYITVIDN